MSPVFANIYKVKSRLFNGQAQAETPAQAQQRKEMIQRVVATQLQTNCT